MSATLLPKLAPVPVDTPGPGIVYSESIVWSAPEQFVQDAPYQLAIIELDGGERITARITGSAVKIGDRVDLAEFRAGIPFFRRIA